MSAQSNNQTSHANLVREATEQLLEAVSQSGGRALGHYALARNYALKAVEASQLDAERLIANKLAETAEVYLIAANWLAAK